MKEDKYLLPPKSENKINLKTLVLDLDETLAHGQNIPFNSDKNQIILECKLNNINTKIYVKLRPGIKEFLRKMNKLYEIIIFTASVEEYAKPLIELIDNKNYCSYILYREQCTLDNMIYIKDLKKLGRDLKDIIIIDNTPISYKLNKENGIPISSFIDDDNDRELYDIIQILDFLSYVDDVRYFIPKFIIGDEISYFASLDIIRKYKNNNFKNNNQSAINFHPFINSDLDIKNNNQKENYSIINENKEDYEQKEKDLINISESLFDDIILNENINRTDLDININEDITNITKNEELEKNNEIKNKEGDNKIKSIDTKEINNIKSQKENKSKKKEKIIQKNNNIRKIRHNKSNSYNINIISNYNILMPNSKTKKETLIKNKNKINLTVKNNTKSKTVKRPKKLIIEEKSKIKLYRPRNVISEFKQLRTLNNSINNTLYSKNNSKLISTYTPKKSKKNKEKSKIKEKEESKLNNTIKTQIEINKKELIKKRKKTPYRIHQKKEKQKENNISSINKTIKIMKEKEKENIVINIKKKNIKENNSSLKQKNNNNHKLAKSSKNFHIKKNNNKKYENKLPWGWGGYTLKLSDFDNLFNYNYESREIRIAKLDLDIYKRAKSHKPIKTEKNKVNKESKDNNETKRKRGISSSNSTNNMINKNKLE